MAFDFINKKPQEEEAQSAAENTASAEVGGAQNGASNEEIVGQMVIKKPTSFSQVVEMADEVNNCNTVFMNMEDADLELTRRILDFMAGVSYANEANMKRVSETTYVIIPYNMSISGDLADEPGSNGGSN